MNDYKSGKLKILVCTDVAARGLDIKQIKTVVNYDIARDIDSHVHRIGRTGRAGEKGTAFSLLTQKEDRFASELVRNLEESNQRVDKKLMDLAMKNPYFRKARSGFSGGRGRGRGRGGRGGSSSGFNPNTMPIGGGGRGGFNPNTTAIGGGGRGGFNPNTTPIGGGGGRGGFNPNTIPIGGGAGRGNGNVNSHTRSNGPMKFTSFQKAESTTGQSTSFLNGSNSTK